MRVWLKSLQINKGYATHKTIRAIVSRPSSGAEAQIPEFKGDSRALLPGAELALSESLCDVTVKFMTQLGNTQGA